MRKFVLSCAALPFLSPVPVSAALIPFWRINPINPAAIAEAPVLANAVSVSLMVELTGSTRFNVAGLDLNLLYPDGRFYQRVGGGGTTLGTPLPEDIANSPALEFDTYVSGADPNIPTNSPGRLRGTGPSQIGNSNLSPTSGPHRTGQFFNVAWGGQGVTGGPGVHEIARITTIGQGVQFIPLTLDDGLVFDNETPGVGQGLPPIPVAIVPEPGVFAAACSVLILVCRRRARPITP